MKREGGFRKSMYLLIPAVLAFLSTGIGAAWAGNDSGRTVVPKEARKLIRENATNPKFGILDVRTPGEFARGHLEGALLVDYRSPGFREELAGLDRTKTYLVYCRTGHRSALAMGVMKELGFQRPYHLVGGITRWIEQGLPTVR